MTPTDRPPDPRPDLSRLTEPGLRRDVLIRKGLRFPQLRLMVALQDTGQISGAAAAIAMTQPAASRLLAELERTVGARLYARHPRGIALTDAGRAFAERARQVLHLLDMTATEVGGLGRGERGLVRIGAVTGPALEIVRPVIRELRVTYPDIELSVQVDTSDKLAEGLLSRDLDFYLGRLPDTVDARSVTLEPIAPEPVSLLVRLNHPLGRKGSVTLKDCLAYDWVMQPTGGVLRHTVEHYLLDNGYPPPARVLSTASLLLTLAIISETNAIAPVARSAATFYAEREGLGGRVRPLDVASDMQVQPYSIVRLRDGTDGPAAARVLGLIRNKLDLH